MSDPADLTQTGYTMSSGDPLSFQQLVDQWGWHVDRLVRDIEDGVDDDHAWGAYDVIAAMYARTRLAEGMSAATAPQRESLELLSMPLDERFRELTEADPERTFVRALREDDTIEGWWWSRLPKAGWPRREFDAMRT